MTNDTDYMREYMRSYRPKHRESIREISRKHMKHKRATGISRIEFDRMHNELIFAEHGAEICDFHLEGQISSDEPFKCGRSVSPGDAVCLDCEHDDCGVWE